MTLTEADLEELRGINERVSLDEVADIYVPLARLLSLHVTASQDLFRVTDTFLGKPAHKVPFVIGIAGSVAVGKSTTARILQELLRHGETHRHVDLIATDGFLYPNAVLSARGLMERKGFPESYDRRRIVSFLAAVKSGAAVVEAPVYSHHSYDIVPGEAQVVDRPDILIVEGLNVLQAGDGDQLFVSDLFDFSIYVDAAQRHVEEWYVERFLTLRSTAFRDPDSYFHHWSRLDDAEARATALRIWRDINGRNLVENIAPTKERARLIVEKGADHSVVGVRLRRL